MEDTKKKLTSVELYGGITGFYLCLTVSLQAYSINFLAPEVPHECVQWAQESTLIRNRSNCDGSCQKWEYNHSVFDYTLTEKLNLVCDRAWYISLGNALNMAGDAVGCFIFGHMGDRFGRRPVLLICSILAAVSHAGMLFLQDYNMFLSARFFTGLASYGSMNTMFTLMTEIVRAKYRTASCLILQSGWTWGEVVLLLIAYVNRDWFFSQLAITIAAAILPVFIWFLPESPRWVVQNKVAKISLHGNVGSHVQSKQTQAENENQVNVKKYTVLDLFRTPKIRTASLVVFSYWLTIGFTYFGISLNAGIFGSDLFLNFFLNAIVEFPSLFICLFLDRFTGRKVTLSTYMFGAGIFFFFVIFAASDSWVLTVCVVMGKLFITSAFYLVYVYTTEVFPTVIRSVGFGSSSMCCRIGSILAPFVKELSEAVGLWVPMAVFATLCLLSGMLAFLLPETKGIVLLDTIEETEQANWSRKSSVKGLVDFTIDHKHTSKTKVTLSGIRDPTDKNAEGNYM